jgi:hypothetical protein
MHLAFLNRLIKVYYILSEKSSGFQKILHQNLINHDYVFAQEGETLPQQELQTNILKRMSNTQG